MIHRPLPLLLAVAALLAAPASPAAAADPTPDEAKAAEPAATDAEPAEGQAWYDEIVVAASRAEVKLEQVPLHASVIDELEVRRAPEAGLIDLARQIPGLVLAGDEGGLVANPRGQSLNFRGVSGSQVSHALLLVDGFPVLDPYNASAIWSKVPKELVERIEVVRGGGANLWGSLALSGVVNVVTRSPADPRLDAAARWGSRSTGDLAASAGGAADGWSGWLAGDLFGTDGYHTVPEEERRPVDRPEYRDYLSFTGRGSRTLGDRAIAHLGARYYEEERGEGTDGDFSSEDEQALSAVVDLVAGRGSGELRAFARTGELEDTAAVVSSDGATLTPRYHIPELESTNGGLSALWSFGAAGAQALSAGADFQVSEIVRIEDLDWRDDRFTQRSRVEGRQTFYGAFAQDRWTPDERWSVEAGVRFDAVRTDEGRNLRTDLATGAVREEVLLDANSETTWSPRLGAVFQATPSSRWRGAAYTGFRSPMPSELFVGTAPRNNRENAPNPELEPETLVGAEVGYDYTPGEELSVRTTAYWSRTENLIQRVTIGRVGPEGGVVGACGTVGPNGSCTQRRNTGETRAQGVELDVAWAPSERWRFTAGGILLEAEITDHPEDPALEGNRIERTPERGLTAGVELRHPALDLFLRGRYAGDRYEDPENEFRIPSYTVVDLSLARRLSASWELFGGVENLLGRDYFVAVDSSGTHKIGTPRLWHVGARFRAGRG